jgi:hypothetical protein
MLSISRFRASSDRDRLAEERDRLGGEAQAIMEKYGAWTSTSMARKIDQASAEANADLDKVIEIERQIRELQQQISEL